MNITHTPQPNRLLGDIRQVIEQARSQLARQVNRAMVEAYWHIGRLIVEHEQGGEQRAEYGKQQLKHLADKLSYEYGKGFDERNLRNMRVFYQKFQIWNAVRTELSWTHYRHLIRIDNPEARRWYMEESISQNWSARTLERQIGVLYYERLLSSHDKAAVMVEAGVGAIAITAERRQISWAGELDLR
ncbi:DUF1016 N-terminal domain-containing protein [Massilia sp. W12]|uniref:DUF1016 N-terminal domain-containing protein n=1 Tax=Massilia sp. W12 TaxID=3126507 RepID=UPI0030D1D73F